MQFRYLSLGILLTWANFHSLSASLFPTYQEIIGISYKNNTHLQMALIHPSYNPNNKEFQRLELLGDKGVGLGLTDILLAQHPDWDEGETSQHLSKLTTNTYHTEVAFRLKLMDFAKYKDSDGTGKDKIAADICEAFMGALYLDCKQNISTIKEVLRRFWINKEDRRAKALMPSSPTQSSKARQKIHQLKEKHKLEGYKYKSKGKKQNKRHTLIWGDIQTQEYNSKNEAAQELLSRLQKGDITIDQLPPCLSKKSKKSIASQQSTPQSFSMSLESKPLKTPQNKNTFPLIRNGVNLSHISIAQEKETSLQQQTPATTHMTSGAVVSIKHKTFLNHCPPIITSSPKRNLRKQLNKLRIQHHLACYSYNITGKKINKTYQLKWGKITTAAYKNKESAMKEFITRLNAQEISICQLPKESETTSNFSELGKLLKDNNLKSPTVTLTKLGNKQYKRQLIWGVFRTQEYIGTKKEANKLAQQEILDRIKTKEISITQLPKL